MSGRNFADLDQRYPKTPPELVGVWPLGGGGIVEAPYRHHFELQTFLRHIPLDGNHSLLELGSGNGRWALSLAPRVASYLGVDITPRAVEIALRRVAEHRIENAHFLCRSITEFQCNREVNIVYFSGVSQYLGTDDLRQVIEKLIPSMPSDAWLVDRSTISHGDHAIHDIRPEYSSILRTPNELQSIYGDLGFDLIERVQSYRPLRGGRLLSRNPIDRWLAPVVRATAPVSLNVMLAWSWLLDAIAPIDHVRRGWSHDFFFFRRRPHA